MYLLDTYDVYLAHVQATSQRPGLVNGGMEINEEIAK